jgi:hypothetical protein
MLPSKRREYQQKQVVETIKALGYHLAPYKLTTPLFDGTAAGCSVAAGPVRQVSLSHLARELG